MDFDIPADIAAYLRELDAFIDREIKPLERRTTISASSTIAASMRAPIGTMTASRATNGRSCWPR